MESREKIAAWLGEAAEHSKRMGYAHLITYFENRAAQVAAMRCETCVYWVADIRWNRDKVRECTAMGDKMTPPEYGCFVYKLAE